MDELKKLAAPLQEWLASNYDPMCCIVVQADRVEVLRSEMSIPAEVVEIHEHWINMDDREARWKMNKRKRDFTLWWIDHENEIQCSVMIVVLILKLLLIVVFAILLWKII